MLTPEEIKEAYRLFYMVKGHFNTTLDTVLSSQNGYFKRLWYDGATVLHYTFMKNNLKKPGQNMDKRF